MTHPALKCLRRHLRYLSVQVGGQSSLYTYCGEDGFLSINVSPAIREHGMCVSMEVIPLHDELENPVVQEFLKLLRPALEQEPLFIEFTQSKSAVVLSFVMPNVINECGHFVRDRLPVFLKEYDDLLRILQAVAGTLDFSNQCPEVGSEVIQGWINLILHGAKENVTIH